MNLYDGRAGWVRVQIKLQQLEKNSGIEQRDGKAEGAVETLSSLRSTWTGGGARPHTVWGGPVHLFAQPTI